MTATEDVPFGAQLWSNNELPGPGGPRSYLVVRRRGKVRALLPVDVPRVAQSALRNASGSQSQGQFVLRSLAGMGLRAALRVSVPLPEQVLFVTPGDGVERLLGHVTGAEDGQVAFHFGPPRANLKPVAKIYDGSGRTRAIAKFGGDPLTRRLVTGEATALRHLSQHPQSSALEVPRLLHEGTYGELTFVVQSVVSFAGRQRLPPPDRRIEAERAVVSTGQPSTAPMRSQSYVRDLSDRLHGFDRDEVSRIVVGAGQRLLRSLEDQSVLTGGSHGDWSPQNICDTGQRTGAWDWERWESNRPAGFDALHYRTQTLLADSAHSGPVGVRLLDEAAAVVAPHQRGLDPGVARSLAGLYLVEIAHRYLTDRQADTTSAAGRMNSWLIPALVASSAH